MRILGFLLITFQENKVFNFSFAIKNKGTGLNPSDEEYLVVTRIMSIFALYNVNKHSMLRQKQEKSGTGICHVMQGKESKTCPCDF